MLIRFLLLYLFVFIVTLCAQFFKGTLCRIYYDEIASLICKINSWPTESVKDFYIVENLLVNVILILILSLFITIFLSAVIFLIKFFATRKHKKEYQKYSNSVNQLTSITLRSKEWLYIAALLTLTISVVFIISDISTGNSIAINIGGIITLAIIIIYTLLQINKYSITFNDKGIEYKSLWRKFIIPYEKIKNIEICHYEKTHSSYDSPRYVLISDGRNIISFHAHFFIIANSLNNIQNAISLLRIKSPIPQPKFIHKLRHSENFLSQLFNFIVLQVIIPIIAIAVLSNYIMI